MNNEGKPVAAAKPPMTNSERVARWKETHNPKRKVAEIPHELAQVFESKLQSESKPYQAWLIEQIKEYISRP